MRQTIIGLFDGYTSAKLGVGSLEEAGFGEGQISVVAREDVVQEHLHEEQIQTVLESAGAGAMGGSAVGGLVGLLAGAGTLLLPGVGAALAAAGTAAAAGAGVGAAYGGFIGALIGLGMSEEDAHRYVEGVKQGNLLLVVETSSERASEAASAMRQANPLDVGIRPGRWQVGAEAQEKEASTPDISGEVQVQTVQTLEDLVVICLESRDGFQIAAKNVQDKGLRQLFNSYVEQYGKFASNLQEQVEHLGGTPPKSGHVSEMIQQGWVNIKAALTIERKKTREVVLSAAREGEVATMEQYRAALEKDLSEEVRTIVAEQYAKIKEAYQYLLAVEENEEG